MAFLWPTYTAQSVLDITPQFLKSQGITGLLVDIDNTLALHDCPEPYEGVAEWVSRVKEEGIAFILLSNNSPERTKPFADRLGVTFEAHASKPLGKGVDEAIKMAGGNPMMIGDQIFTDVLAGSFKGIKTVLVKPLSPDFEKFIIFKRYLEKIALLGFRWDKRRIGK